jgi:hypothetical protein
MPERHIHEMSAVAIGILVLIITVAIGATVVQNIQTTQISRATDVNVSDGGNPYTITVNSSVALSLGSKYAGLNPVISYVQAKNSTNGLEISSTNWTTVNTYPQSFNFTGPRYAAATINWSYSVTYYTPGYDFNVSAQGLGALSNYSSFFQVIVVVVIFSVLLGIFAIYLTGRPHGGSV